MIKITSERYSKDMHRIMIGGVVVAFASALANGRWALVDDNDRRYRKHASYDTAKQAIAAWGRP